MSDTIEYLDFSSTLKKSKPYPSIVILDDVIESSVCDRIISQASNFESAGVYRGSFDPQVAKDVRNNQTAWGKENWVYEMIEPHLTHAIKYAGWDFEISTAEPYQVAKSEVGEFHNWHQDGVGPIKGDSLTRKLSLSLILNDDFEGGELEVFPHGPMNFSKGTMVFFPSFQTHQVHPVTKGTRYSLVVWFVGNSWR